MRAGPEDAPRGNQKQTVSKRKHYIDRDHWKKNETAWAKTQSNAGIRVI